MNDPEKFKQKIDSARFEILKEQDQVEALLNRKLTRYEKQSIYEEIYLNPNLTVSEAYEIVWRKNELPKHNG